RSGRDRRAAEGRPAWLAGFDAQGSRCRGAVVAQPATAAGRPAQAGRYVCAKDQSEARLSWPRQSRVRSTSSAAIARAMNCAPGCRRLAEAASGEVNGVADVDPIEWAGCGV